MIVHHAFLSSPRTCPKLDSPVPHAREARLASAPGIPAQEGADTREDDHQRHDDSDRIANVGAAATGLLQQTAGDPARASQGVESITVVEPISPPQRVWARKDHVGLKGTGGDAGGRAAARLALTPSWPYY